MKKLHLILFAALAIATASCTKDHPVPVYTPATNTWIVNTDTLGPANFVYYDTANVLYGGIKGKASITVNFRFKPKSDGKYVFRAIADEIDEVSILVIDSANNVAWRSTDDDGRALKAQQYADITVNGRNIGVAFNEMFLKNVTNVDEAKVSMNIE